MYFKPGLWNVVLVASCFMLDSSLAYSSILKMKANLFLRNVGCLSTDYKAFYPRRQNSSCNFILKPSKSILNTESRLYQFQFYLNFYFSF
jgi:hypothetical protein